MNVGFKDIHLPSYNAHLAEDEVATIDVVVSEENLKI